MNRVNHFFRVFILGCGLCLAASVAQGAPFMNGSFESATIDPGNRLITNLGAGTTSITGWTVTDDNIDYIGGFWQASDGSRSLDMSGCQAGAISQTFDTAPGVQYEVKFDLAGEPFSNPSVKHLRASAAGTSADYTFDTTGHTDVDWQEQTFLFTATDPTATLTFTSLDESCAGPALDNVRVTQGSAPSSKPIANAGPDRSVLFDSTVQLDGSLSSGPQGDPLQYQWRLLGKPKGSTAVLSDPTAQQPTFGTDLLGKYAFELIVSDGTELSDPDTVVISAGTKNQRPKAVISAPKEVRIGDLVQLNANGSFDPDGDSLSFEWFLAVKPSGSTAVLIGSGIAVSFTADLRGQYIIGLRVQDGRGGVSATRNGVKVIEGTPQPPKPVSLDCESVKFRSFGWYECNKQQISQTADDRQRLTGLQTIQNIVIWRFDRDALDSDTSGFAYYTNDMRSGQALGIRQLTQETAPRQSLPSLKVYGDKIAIWTFKEDALFDTGLAYYATCLVNINTGISKLTDTTSQFTRIKKFTVNKSITTASWDFCEVSASGGESCLQQSIALPVCPVP